MTKFETVLTQLKAENENFEKMVYVTGYKNLADYASEHDLSADEAYEEITDLSKLVNPPTKKELNDPFIIIDQSTSTMFEIILSEEINAK